FVAAATRTSPFSLPDALPIYRTRRRSLPLLDLLLGVVPAVDEQLGDVARVDDVRLEQVGRHDLDAVVVGLGVVRLRLLAGEEGLGGHDRLGGQLARVLEDRRVLDVLGDERDRGDLRVLAGDDRQALADRRAVALAL